MSFLHLITRTTSRCLLQARSFKNVQQQSPRCNPRQLWGYVAIAFNKVDADRLKQVGPNRLCAEWIIKNGGGVRLTENPSKLWKDYNSLPSENTKFNIKVADASNSSIMKIGMEHFVGCKHIDTVILHNCKHLEGDSLEGLLHLVDSLHTVQVSGCYNINDDGLMVLGQLKNLRQLIIFDMVYVKDMEEVQAALSGKLPGCKIEASKFDLNVA